MKKTKVIIKFGGEKYIHNDKKIKSSMSTAFTQKSLELQFGLAKSSKISNVLILAV